MEENKKFNAELEIVRFEDTDVITASPCTADGCTAEDPCLYDGCPFDCDVYVT